MAPTMYIERLNSTLCLGGPRASYATPPDMSPRSLACFIGSNLENSMSFDIAMVTLRLRMGKDKP